MDHRTSAQLQALNRGFYHHHAAAFDRTRQSPWPGWHELLRLCGDLGRPLRVFDAGCGNGRFGAFLADRLGGQVIDYTACDSSEQLLSAARNKLAERFASCHLLQLDLLDNHLDERLSGRQFDWIALFGVVHHIAGFEQRSRLLRRLGRYLQPGGRLTASLWRFDLDPRQGRKILPWPRHLAGQPLDRSQLEPGDHLLSWGGEQGRPRYCHLTEPPEAARLMAASGMREVAHLAGADATGGDGNDYLVLAPATTAGP